MLKDEILYFVMIVIVAFLGAINGYLVGHEAGWFDGVQVGHAEKVVKEGKYHFEHNGKPE